MLFKAIPARLIQQAAICGMAFAVPVIAFAQYRPSSEVMQIERANEAMPMATNLVEQAAPPTASCTEQHWPNYSKDCLRGATAGSEPRRISLVASSVRPESPVKPVPSAKKRRSSR